MSESLAESSSKVSNAKPRVRLSSEGSAILQEYWARHPGEMPPLAVRKQLTEEIKKTPGNEFYKIVNTNGWFKRRVDEARKATSSQVDPRFPSLSAEVIKSLEVLSRNQPNPPPELVEAWANMIARTGASYQDVVAWVHTTTLERHADGLLTPATTVSPEPPKFAFFSGSMSPTQSQFTASREIPNQDLKKSPTHSPVLLPSPSVQTSLSLPNPPHWRPWYNASPVSPATPVTPSPSTATPLLRPRVSTLQEAIIQGVADAVASPSLSTPPDTLPSNAAEFNAMFSSYEKQLLQLMQALESS